MMIFSAIVKHRTFRTSAEMPVILAVLIAASLTAQTNAQCNRACYPQFVDLVMDIANRSISINSTCGKPPGEYELRIATAVGDTFQLTVCNASEPGSAHPETAIYDVTSVTIFNQVFTSPNLDTWWQSENGVRNVFLVLDLVDEFLFQQTILSFRSYRPDSVIIEKTVDGGVSWTALRYYARNCAATFPGVLQSLTFNFTADCRQVYVFGDRLTEVEGQNIQQMIYNPVQELEQAYFEYEYLRYFAVTGLRITLVEPGSSDQLRSYFAVADWNVQGQCLCYGHAAQCTGPNEAECVCQHNTMGSHCDACLPLYNNRPWQTAVGTQTNACEDCGCSGRADSCVYDAAKGYGVCQNCRENTAGDKCEVCVPEYYRNPYTNPLFNDTCIACNCTVEGSVPGTVCNETNGQCECKTNVQGRSCDECRDTFYNLQMSNDQGCQACNCDPIGTAGGINLCDKVTGECICKENVMGTRCDQCKPGTFDLNPNNPAGCTPCNCDPGAAISGSCDPDTGSCTCRPHIVGRSCNDTEPGYYVPRLDGIMAEGEMAVTDQTVDIEERALGPDARHSGTGFLVVPPSTIVTFNGIYVPRTQNYAVIVRYQTSTTWPGVTLSVMQQTPESFDCQGTTLSGGAVSTSVDLSPSVYGGAFLLISLCLRGNASHDISISLGASDGGSSAILLLDSIVLLPIRSDLEVYTSSRTSNDTKASIDACWDASVSVDPRARGNCSDIEFAIMAEVFNGAIPCDCNSLGSESGATCDAYGGQCPCSSGVKSRSCDTCAPFFYGIESENGCTACECNPLGSVDQSCNQTTGMCDCLRNIVGDKCGACEVDHYGLQTGEGCTPCTCAPEFSLGTGCTDAGQCSCKPGVGGLNCTECSPGFFNLTSAGCVECNCNPIGSEDSTCDSQGQCSCLPSATGLQCDECPAGTYGFGSYSERGCIECLCSSHTTNCTAANDWYVYRLESHYSLLNLEGAVSERWTGITGDGVDVEILSEPILEISDPRFVLQLMDPGNTTDLFFVAPQIYHGDRRTAYGQIFEFTLSQTTSENQTISPNGDVFIYGQYVSEPLVAMLPMVPASPVTNATVYQFKLHENYWRVGSPSGRMPSTREVVLVLSSITGIRVRAKYTTLLGQSVYFHDASLTLATNDVSLSTGNVLAGYVEDCNCPPEYTGQFCEQCAPGYHRASPGLGPFSDCILCDCNGHSTLPCDSETGFCMECQDNTAGNFCQRCQDGYYGNATVGTPNDCQPCLCPGEPGTNSFAATCDSDGICVNCTEGHGGDHCEFCVDGYYGVPMDIQNNGGQCQACFCNLSPASCDSTTGQCLNCTGNTDGQTCDVCEFGYWGSIDNCQVCICNLTGGYGNCTQDAGVCYCYPNVIGDRCTECAPDTWGFASGDGCTDCDCHPVGTRTGQTQCDLITGQCDCKERVTGQQCDQCTLGYYNVDQECIPCNCNTNGTMASTCVDGLCGCDLESGQCSCKLTTIAGRTCDRCGRISDDAIQVVEEIFVGNFPNCDPCPECFQNWRQELEILGEDLVLEQRRLLMLLRNYGNMSVTDVDGMLQAIRGNLTYAHQVIEDGIQETDNLQEIQTGFEMISEAVQNQTALLNTISSLEGNISALLNRSSEFQGSVEVEQGVTRTSDQLDLELSAVTNTLDNIFVMGNETWVSIQALYQEVVDFQVQAQQLIAEVGALMSDVEAAARQRQTVEQILVDASRSAETDVNAQRLQLIDSVYQGYPLDVAAQNVSLAQGLVEDANATAREALQRAVDGRAASESRVYQSEVARFNATGAASAAGNALTEALTYQAVALSAKDNMTAAYVDTINAIAELTAAETSSQEAQQAATATQGMTVRASADMLGLVQQINATSLADGVVDPLLENATASLARATESLNVSQQALQDALAVRSQVDTIEYDLAEAARVREVTLQNMNHTSSNVTNINDIARQVQDLGQSKLTDAETTSALVQDLTTQATGGQACFSGKRDQAEDAVRRTTIARQQTEVAQEELQIVVQEEQNLESLVTTATDEASNNYAGVKDVYDDAQILSSDVVTAANMADLNALITRYMTQRTEMEQLTQELDQLESDLDAVLTNLQGIGTGEIQCND